MKSNQFLKSFIIVTAVFAFSSILSNVLKAQDSKYSEKDIPQTVLESFKKSYPNATVKGYDIENENGIVTYEIESKDGNIQRDVEYTADGSIFETGEFIDANSLPENIKNLINSKFNNAKILEAERKTKGSEITYEVLMNDAGKKSEVLFDSNGNVIKDKDDDEENENEESDD